MLRIRISITCSFHSPRGQNPALPVLYLTAIENMSGVTLMKFPHRKNEPQRETNRKVTQSFPQSYAKV